MQHSFIDKYSDIESPIHRLDPRTKIISFLGFIFVVISTPRYYLLNFAFYAMLILLTMALSGIPIFYILKRSCLILPFAIMTAAFIPFYNSYSTTTGDILKISGVNISRNGLWIL